MSKALFTGTFDPPSLGHLDLIERAAHLVDHLTIGVAALNHKPNALFPLKERLSLLEEITSDLNNVTIVAVTGLTVDLAAAHDIDLLIRGVRSPADLDDELRMASANRTLTGIETLFLPASPETAQISSTLIREIGAAGGDLTPFVPAPIVSKVTSVLAK